MDTKTNRPHRLQFDDPTVFQRVVWWCRLRCAAIATGAGLIVVVEVVAFCFVGIPYHLKAIDEAEAAGYNRGRADAGLSISFGGMDLDSIRRLADGHEDSDQTTGSGSPRDGSSVAD